jgi:hypothetical protein
LIISEADALYTSARAKGLALIIIHILRNLGAETDNSLVNLWFHAFSACGWGRIIFVERLA